MPTAPEVESPPEGDVPTAAEVEIPEFSDERTEIRSDDFGMQPTQAEIENPAPVPSHPPVPLSRPPVFHGQGSAAPPLSRAGGSAPWSVVLREVMDRFRREAPVFVVGGALLIVVRVLLAFAAGFLALSVDPGAARQVIQGVSTLAFLIVVGFLFLGLVAVALDAVDGRVTSIRRLFSQVRRLPAFLLQLVVLLALPLLGYGAVVGVGYVSFGGMPSAEVFAPFWEQWGWAVATAFCLGVVVYVWVFGRLSFMPFFLVDDPTVTALGAARRSILSTRGKNLLVLSAVAISLGILLLGVLALLVGLFAAVPAVVLLFAILYRAHGRRT
ncbi:MAG: hypothetical protein KC416_08830 [Myxococcales bacterium]|nr:hypothetical protein [Myxococcales bacterium]